MTIVDIINRDEGANNKLRRMNRRDFLRTAYSSLASLVFTCYDLETIYKISKEESQNGKKKSKR